MLGAGRSIGLRYFPTLSLNTDWPRRPLQKVDLQHGKPSITDWQVLGFDAALNKEKE